MKRFGLMALVLTGALAAGMAFTACGGSDDKKDDGGKTPAAGTTATVGSTPASAATTGSGDAQALAVTAKDFSFTLDLESVTAGSEVDVALRNEGSAPHTITFYEDADYTKAVAGADSGRVAGGGTGAFQFTAPEGDELYYRCEVHPSQMKGELAIN